MALENLRLNGFSEVNLEYKGVVSEEIEIPLRQAQNKTLIADFVSGEYTLDVIEK